MPNHLEAMALFPSSYSDYMKRRIKDSSWCITNLLCRADVSSGDIDQWLNENIDWLWKNKLISDAVNNLDLDRVYFDIGERCESSFVWFLTIHSPAGEYILGKLK